jgi:hypothetical protein
VHACVHGACNILSLFRREERGGERGVGEAKEKRLRTPCFKHNPRATTLLLQPLEEQHRVLARPPPTTELSVGTDGAVVLRLDGSSASPLPPPPPLLLLLPMLLVLPARRWTEVPLGESTASEVPSLALRSNSTVLRLCFGPVVVVR